MIVDIIILILVIFAGIQGYRHGFVQALLQTMGWILSVVLAFLWSPQVSDFLLENTTLYDVLSDNISANIAIDDVSFSNSLNSFPSFISDILMNTANTISDTIATKISDIIFAILCFFLVVIALKILFFLIVQLFSKESNGGILGGIDGFLGLIMGTLKGLILVFVLLALIVPFTAISGNTFLLEAVKDSLLGDMLFSGNIIFYFFS